MEAAEKGRLHDGKDSNDLAARTASGYRVFPADSLARMRMIRAGLSVGFSVAELGDILRERNAGGAPCQRVRKLAAKKLSLLEAKWRDLRRWRRELRSILSAWDRLLARTPRGKQARLLETLRRPKSRSENVARGIRNRRA